jgi:3-keto-L-gulonate-6-phosphate decarboxylase
MGQVVGTNRFWNRVPRTQTAETEPVVIGRASLDTLTSAVEIARNRVVHCQCDLAKAENAYAEAQATWADAVLERGSDLGIPEFCQIQSKRRPRTRADED